MIYAAAQETIKGPEVAIAIALLLAILILIGGAASFYLEIRKSKILASQEDALRQLVKRYEQLAEGTLDAQKRLVADVSEIQTRTSAMEQILRSVE